MTTRSCCSSSSSGHAYYYLTKSLFLEALQCPHKLAYALSPHYYDHDNHQKNFLRDHLVSTGLKIGAYSRLLFPHGIEVMIASQEEKFSTSQSSSSSLSSAADNADQLVQETTRLLSLDHNYNHHHLGNNSYATVTLFEAAIRSGPFFIRPDILQQTFIHPIDDTNATTTTTTTTSPNTQQPRHRHLHLYEVKAKAWDSSLDRDALMRTKTGGIQSKFLPYLQDVAFQKYVLQQAFANHHHHHDNNNDNNNNNNNKNTREEEKEDSTLQISCSLIMPDKAAVHTQIPNLNRMFRVIHDDDDSTTTTTCTTTAGGSPPPPRGVLMEKADRTVLLHHLATTDEKLVAVVDVDDLVEEILDGPLQFPGSRSSSSSSTHDTFRSVVQQWGHQLQLRQVEERDKGNEQTEQCPADSFESLFWPPPIGSQCKDCHYRRQDKPTSKSCHDDDYDDETPLLAQQQCWQQATGLDPDRQNDLVIDLYHGNAKTITKLLDAGKFLMSNVEPTDLGLTTDGVDPKKKDGGLSRKEKQWHQVSNTPHPVLAVDYLQAEMLDWTYPYHFIDFETIAPALPYSINKSPFTTLAFQFSHHVMERDGSIEHVNDFLFVEPGECPNRWFLQALSESLTSYDKGTVFRWGAHENTILTALLRSRDCHDESYPVLDSLITGGSRAMVDLMRLLDKGYYAPGSGASSSIKRLLLPTMKESGLLKQIYGKPTYSGRNFTNMQWWVESPSEIGVPTDPYTLLASIDASSVSSSVGVAHGGDAITAFDRLQTQDLDAEARLALKTALLRYCELDTLAMAMMMQGVQDLLRHSK